jgi:hypothetical protein
VIDLLFIFAVQIWLLIAEANRSCIFCPRQFCFARLTFLFENSKMLIAFDNIYEKNVRLLLAR